MRFQGRGSDGDVGGLFEGRTRKYTHLPLDDFIMKDMSLPLAGNYSIKQVAQGQRYAWKRQSADTLTPTHWDSSQLQCPS